MINASIYWQGNKFGIQDLFGDCNAPSSSFLPVSLPPFDFEGNVRGLSMGIVFFLILSTTHCQIAMNSADLLK
jgi:hypothetical protein